MEFGVVRLGIVIAIILILLSLAINAYYPLMIRSINTEIAYYIYPIRRDMIVSYLVRGEWPQSIDPKDFIQRTRYIRLDKITNDNGSQDYAFHYWNNPETKYTLSLRRVPEDQAATFVWVCGYGNHEEGLKTPIEDNTTMPTEALPYRCR